MAAYGLERGREATAGSWRLESGTDGSPFHLAKVEVTGLATEVDGICISSLVGVEKPDEGIFQEAARSWGLL